MPQRKTILATGETYHIFNRSLRQVPLFTSKNEYELFLLATKYYLQSNPPVKFSIYRLQMNKYHVDFKTPLVKIISYCLMPNHYHFLLTQLKEQGIKKFIHRLSNSYAHYFNIKNNQKGPVFESKFKAVRIENQEQLIHLSRYIHLNPVTSFIVEDPKDYEFSSYDSYLHQNQDNFVDNSDVMIDFKSTLEYQKFVLDQKDYQRELNYIKHLLME